MKSLRLALRARSYMRQCVPLQMLAAQSRHISSSNNIPLMQNHDEFTQFSENEEREKKKEQQARDEEEEIRRKILDAGLKHVPTLGWTNEALVAAVKDLGYPATMSSVVGQPDVGLVHHHLKWSIKNLETVMQKEVENLKAENQAVRAGQFLRKSVEARLRMNIPYIGKWSEAIALMNHPQNFPESLCLDLDLMNLMWHYAGDKSTDTNWYTKRMSLLVVYKSTELAMIQDKSEDFRDTWKFLERRFEDHFNLASLIPNCSLSDLETVSGGLVTTARVLLGLQPR